MGTMKSASSLAFVLCLAAIAAACAPNKLPDDDVKIACTTAGTNTEQQVHVRDAVLSPNGHTVAFIREVKSVAMPDGVAGALWIGDCRTGKSRQLLASHSEPGEGEGVWVTLSHPVVTLDGGAIYVSGGFGGSSLLLYRVDIQTARYSYVTAAELVGIIKNGPYRGDLLATKHTLLVDKEGHQFGGYPLHILKSDGSVVHSIAGSERWDDNMMRHWLLQQKWEIQ